MAQRFAHFWLGSVIGLVLLLSSCGGSEPSATIAPTSTSALTTTPNTPAPTSIPTVAPTSIPTLLPTSVPTLLPTSTATPVAESPDSSIPGDAAMLSLRTIPTSDGFVAVRQRPTTSSSEVARLNAGSAVACTGFVAGESLLFGEQYSDQWAACPSVGGYIFAPLLTTEDTPVAAPAAVPGNDNDAIVAAVRAYLDSGFNYGVENICIDGDFATALVVPDEADSVLSILERQNGSWTVIHFKPGMPIIPPDYLAQLGIPDDFACYRR